MVIIAIRIPESAAGSVLQKYCVMAVVTTPIMMPATIRDICGDIQCQKRAKFGKTSSQNINPTTSIPAIAPNQYCHFSTVFSKRSLNEIFPSLSKT